MRINHAAELARAEEFAEAFNLMQNVVDDDPRNVSALSYAAALAEHQKDLDSAKSYYRRVIRLEPDNDEVNWTLARYAVQEKDYKRAEDYYRNIIGERLYFLFIDPHVAGSSRAAIPALCALESKAVAIPRVGAHKSSV